MRLQVKGKNVEVTPTMREYAERKLAKLSKQLAEQTQVEVELSEQRNPSIAASHVAEATIFTKGPTLRAREASPDMRASIDQLVDKLERQITRYREKRGRRRRPARQASDQGIPMNEEPQIVRSKQFAVKPMSAEEAVLQLELVGHDFFVFRHADSDEVAIVYRRREGGYGLIEPQ
jgi:putative sigma-54 modulation protein